MKKRNIVVIGGGPAGLMAAGQAAQGGADVILLEKMNRPGRKLRITGNGRGNLTNTAPLRDFLQRFGPGGRFLRGAFGQFFNRDLLAFFETIGVQTTTEDNGRVFPVSNQAQNVVERLVQWATACGVEIRSETRVTRLLVEDGRITGVETLDQPFQRGKSQQRPTASAQNLPADAVILATGGKSYPGTGSTGDGYRLAEAAGHRIVPIRPALVPLETAGDTAERLMGLSFSEAKVSLWINGRKWTTRTGEILFTHFGLSGPLILALSREVVDALRDGQQAQVSLDLMPDMDDRALDALLLRELDTHGKQQIQTLLKGLLPRTLVPVCCDLVGIPPERVGHQVTAKERKRLRLWLKDFRLEVSGYRTFKEAIVTAGGVDTDEVDPQTMQSRRVQGLYFAGEVLDVDAETGGYNLQAAFSTGWAAGRAAAQD